MGLTLERLVYCSAATVSTNSLLVIADILAVSQRNNLRDGLTGALAIGDGWFFQVIEGQKSYLDALIIRLSNDPRHKDIIILSRKPVKGRLFSDWSMQSARITPEISDDIRIMINECRTSPEDATAALVRLLSVQNGTVSPN